MWMYEAYVVHLVHVNLQSVLICPITFSNAFYSLSALVVGLSDAVCSDPSSMNRLAVIGVPLLHLVLSSSCVNVLGFRLFPCMNISRSVALW